MNKFRTNQIKINNKVEKFEIQNKHEIEMTFTINNILLLIIGIHEVWHSVFRVRNFLLR